MRSILTWRVSGEDLIGTFHAPEQAAAASRRPGAGVLLLNSGATPRAGSADLSARIADRLALRGIPAFRFDFAGLGDSSGPAPVDAAEHWRAVLEGRDDEATLLLARRIKREFGLRRLFVGGLGSAALPAIRAAAGKGREFEGLILLEPALHLDQARTAALGDPAASPDAAQAPQPGLPRWSERLLAAFRGSALARALRPARGHLARWLHGILGRPLPADANVALVRHWERGLEHGVGSLVVVAVGRRIDGDLARILQSLAPASLAPIDVVRVARTNQSFTSGAAREIVPLEVERWVSAREGRAPSRAEPSMQRS